MNIRAFFLCLCISFSLGARVLNKLYLEVSFLAARHQPTAVEAIRRNLIQFDKDRNKALKKAKNDEEYEETLSTFQNKLSLYYYDIVKRHLKNYNAAIAIYANTFEKTVHISSAHKQAFEPVEDLFDEYFNRFNGF